MPYHGQSRVISWIDFTDGAWWEMTPVIDHDQSTDRAVAAARVWARNHDFRVEVLLPPPHRRRFDTWRFRFVKREEVTGDAQAG